MDLKLEVRKLERRETKQMPGCEDLDAYCVWIEACPACATTT